MVRDELPVWYVHMREQVESNDLVQFGGVRASEDPEVASPLASSVWLLG